MYESEAGCGLGWVLNRLAPEPLGQVGGAVGASWPGKKQLRVGGEEWLSLLYFLEEGGQCVVGSKGDR